MKKAAPSTGSIEFTSILERSDNKLWGCHFEVPARIAKKLIVGESHRVVCILNDTAPRQCALIPHGNGSFVITVNKSLRDKLGLSFGMQVEVSLRKDTSEYGLPIAEELNELFRQDKEGSRVFHALTRGKQRTLLYIIGKARNSEKRIAQSLIIVNHLKANKGKINYKQLSLALRGSRHF